MNALVGYGSSDDEDVDDVQPERPAKIARTIASDVASEPKGDIRAPIEHQDSNPMRPKNMELPIQTSAPSAPESIPHEFTPALPLDLSRNAIVGPAIPSPCNNEYDEEDTATNTPLDVQLSPYSTERQRIHDLTLPRTANLAIPASPPPPSSTEETSLAAALGRTTAKFTRFREMKMLSADKRGPTPATAARAGGGSGGVHFHDRLLQSAALRNPSLFPTLLRFAGVSEKESYGTVLKTGESGGVAEEWPEECYVEGLMRLSERRRKERAKGREKVDFVPAANADGNGGGGGRGGS